MMSAFTYEQGVPSERSHQSRLPGPRSRSAGPLAVGLPQHPDQHRPERPIILAVDQRWAESYGSAGLQNSPIPSTGGSRTHEDVEQLGTGSRPKGARGARGVGALGDEVELTKLACPNAARRIGGTHLWVPHRPGGGPMAISDPNTQA